MAVRLLFDENLAAHLVVALATEYPESAHVIDVLGRAAKDDAIWEHARRHNFVIATKDEDFQRFCVWRGFPPKVVWIRLGNCSMSDVAELLRIHVADVQAFVEHPDAGFLPLGRGARDG